MRKGIKAHGLRVQDGRLVVPMRAGGELQSLQYIGPDGVKRFLTDGRVTGCYYSIGSTHGAATLCIAEGFATAASIHEATGRPVAVAFNAGNLLPVAKALREKYPEQTLIICADDDAGAVGNTGLTKATEAAQAVDGLLAVPDFGADRPDGATDFNDLATAQGPEAVRHCIEHASAPAQKNTGWQAPDPIDAEEWQTARLTPPCIVENYLYADVAVKAAPGGIGKTTVTLFEAVHIALGLPLYGLQIYKPGPVGILTAEDSREMLVARLRRIAEGMGLTAAQIAQVMRLVRISDVSGAGYRLTEIIADTVRPAAFADALAEGLAELAPVLVTIDPAVSFGVGEIPRERCRAGLNRGRQTATQGAELLYPVHPPHRQAERPESRLQTSTAAGVVAPLPMVAGWFTYYSRLMPPPGARPPGRTWSRATTA